MESDLFGGSLGNKATPSKSSKPSEAAVPDSKEKLKTDKNPPTSGETQPTPSSLANGIRLMNCEFPVNLLTLKKKILELGAEIPI